MKKKLVLLFEMEFEVSDRKIVEFSNHLSQLQKLSNHSKIKMRGVLK